MASFAERMGTVEPRSVLQITELDGSTRVHLWNVIVRFRDGQYRWNHSHESAALRNVWEFHWILPRDQFTIEAALRRLRADVTEGDYVTCLGAIEAWVKGFPHVNTRLNGDAAAVAFNDAFELCLVGFRFVDLELVPVTEQAEVQAIDDALADLAAYQGARDHLSSALRALADRSGRSYARCVAEAISAVEAVVREMTGENTLGAGLKKLKSSGFELHPALERAWSNLYGYTSDEKGVRHGHIDPSEIDEKLATYMLVSCSAFVSLLIKVDAEAHK